MKLRILALSLAGLAAAIVPVAMNADTPGHHPAYLHARSDLRRAQFLMRIPDEPNVTRYAGGLRSRGTRHLPESGFCV